MLRPDGELYATLTAGSVKVTESETDQSSSVADLQVKLKRLSGALLARVADFYSNPPPRRHGSRSGGSSGVCSSASVPSRQRARPGSSQPGQNSPSSSMVLTDPCAASSAQR